MKPPPGAHALHVPVRGDCPERYITAAGDRGRPSWGGGGGGGGRNRFPKIDSIRSPDCIIQCDGMTALRYLRPRRNECKSGHLQIDLNIFEVANQGAPCCLLVVCAKRAVGTIEFRRRCEGRASK